MIDPSTRYLFLADDGRRYRGTAGDIARQIVGRHPVHARAVAAMAERVATEGWCMTRQSIDPKAHDRV